MSQELVDSLNKQVEQYIHGTAREEILAQLEQNPTTDTMAQIVHDLIMGLAETANSRGAPVELDIILAVATEAIDILAEIIEAMGAPEPEGPDALREETLVKIVILHMESVQDDPEEKAAAMEMLQELTADGSVDEAMGYVQKRTQMTAEQMRAQGEGMVAPKMNPLSEGVQKGLMQ